MTEPATAAMCPGCGAPNSAFNARCARCGALLASETTPVYGAELIKGGESPRDRSAVDALGETESAERGGAPPEVRPGAKLGRFELLDRLGNGAMGEVLRARDPLLGREVAIKVLRSRSSGRSGEGRARLVREAMAMAKIKHPNVVTVHEVDVTGPEVLVVMEYVEGRTLRVYCAEERLRLAEVVRAFVQAGHGLSAAHRAGLVHRDFKPDNVLVGDDGRVRVTDFGLVGIGEGHAGSTDAPLDHGLSPEGSLTRTGTLLGTPAYMAPEQHELRALDARADQFAFCVALWEALAGELPFAGETYKELRENVTQGILREPPPGAKLPARIRRILVRGLSASRDARYPDMEALLSDLARDPAILVRRTLGAAGVLALATLASLAIDGLSRRPTAALCQPQQDLAGVWDADVRGRVQVAFLRTERSYAEDTATRVTALLDRYSADYAAMRSEVCEASRGGREPREILAQRELCLERRRGQLKALTALFEEKPDPEVLDHAVKAAAELHPIAYCADTEALTARVRPPEDPAVRARVKELEPQVDRLEALYMAGKYRESHAVGEPLLAEAKALPYAPLRAQVEFSMGCILTEETSDYEAAKALLRAAAISATEGGDDRLTARAWTKVLFVVSERQQRFEEADAVRVLGPMVVARARDDRVQAAWLHAEGSLLYRRGKYAEARAVQERALPLWEKAVGREHPSVAAELSSLGLTLSELGDAREAVRVLERALVILEKVQGPDHPDTAMILNNLAKALDALGDSQRVLSTHERALAIREKTLGPDHPDVAETLNNLGTALYGVGDYPKALSMHERALAIWEKTLGPDHPDVAWSLVNIGSVLWALGDYPKALSALERALALREKGLGPDHPEVALVLVNMGNVLLDVGEPSKAARAHERALALWTKALGPDHLYVAYALTGLGRAEVRLGRLKEALPRFERALALREKALGPSSPELSETLLGLGELHLARREPQKAALVLERALSLHDAEHRAFVQLALAEALWLVGADRARARALAEQARAARELAGHRPGLELAVRWLAAHPR